MKKGNCLRDATEPGSQDTIESLAVRHPDYLFTSDIGVAAIY
jgi:hypothetical protein